MPKNADPAKQKKQLALVAVLLIGLVVAIVTMPSPSKTPTDVRAAKTASATTQTESTRNISQGSASPKSETKIDKDRFVLRDLSRIDWEQARKLNLFRARAMEAALAGDALDAGGPMRVEAIYGTVSSDELLKRSGATTSNAMKPGSESETKNAPSVRRSALIGQAIVRPGGALPDGRTVLSVTTEGVAVAP